MNNSQLPCKPASRQLSYVIVHILNMILELFKIISDVIWGLYAKHNKFSFA